MHNEAFLGDLRCRLPLGFLQPEKSSEDEALEYTLIPQLARLQPFWGAFKAD